MRTNFAKPVKLTDEDIYNIILSPIITEKATLVTQYNQYTFEVLRTACKPEIKHAVEKLFGVSVENVQTLIVKGKRKVFKGRRGIRSDYKKAIVTLKEGQTIDTSSQIKA